MRRWGLWLLALGAFVPKGLSETNFFQETYSDQIFPPLTCKDILFASIPARPDPSLDSFLKLGYVQCIALMALEDQRERAPEKEKPLLTQRIQVLQDFLSPIITAFRVGMFVFRHTNLREQLDDAVTDAPFYDIY